jgi:hypothetical protein
MKVERQLFGGQGWGKKIQRGWWEMNMTEVHCIYAWKGHSGTYYFVYLIYANKNIPRIIKWNYLFGIHNRNYVI